MRGVGHTRPTAGRDMKNYIRGSTLKTRVLRVGVTLDRAQATYWRISVTFRDIERELVKIVGIYVEP